MSPPWTAGFSFHRQLWTTSQRSVAEPTRHEETKPKSIAITGIFGFFLVVLNAALRFAVGARDSTQNEKGKETESSSGAWLDFRVSTFPSFGFASSAKPTKRGAKTKRSGTCSPLHDGSSDFSLKSFCLQLGHHCEIVSLNCPPGPGSFP